MHRKRSAAAAFLLAISASLMTACSDDETTTPTTAAGGVLVGTWYTEGPADEPVVVLDLQADGTWTYKWGQSPETVSLAGSGIYRVDGDTVTWFGGECDTGTAGVYTFTITGDGFTQEVENDPCVLRTLAFDGGVHHDRAHRLMTPRTTKAPAGLG